MGCRCKDKSSYTPSAMGVSRSFPSPDETGTIMLQSMPECVEPYSGPYRKLTVYVAGFNSEHEKLFRRNQRAEALQYARANKTSLDPIVAAELCSDAVETLFA
jgi:hypothetical protein